MNGKAWDRDMLGLLKEEENSSRHILRVQDVPTHPGHGRLALLDGGDVLAGEVAGDQVGVDQAGLDGAHSDPAASHLGTQVWLG